MAGPGTGKTRTLVARYQCLLDRGVHPEQLFTVTFTTKAAGEIRERLGLAGPEYRRLPIGTFNSLAQRVVKESYEVVGLPPDFKLIKEQDQYAILRGLETCKDVDPADALETISRWKGRLLGVEEAMREAAMAPISVRSEQTLSAHAYRGYQEELGRRGLIDYDDQIKLAVQVLSDSKARTRHASRYAYLMVDEYQDINAAQNALLTALLDGHKNIWMVGDDDQAIYGWRGSDPKFILEFERRFSGAVRYELVRNYRSHPHIISAAQALVEGNKHRLRKDLQATQPNPTGRALAVRVRQATDEHHEADGVAAAIQTLLAHRVPAIEIAVLVRAKYLCLPVTAALRRRGIPYQVTDGSDFWSLVPVQAVIWGLQRLRSAKESRAWRVPRRLEEPLAALAVSAKDLPFGEAAARTSRMVADYAPHRSSAERRTEWVESALQAGVEAQAFASAAGFLAYVDDVRAPTARVPDQELVAVSTIHGAKGLEWTAVFAAGWEAGILPHEKAEDREEERRLAYVACTRAKRYLVVSYALSRHGKPGWPSPFIEELVGGLPADCLPAAWPDRPVPRPKITRPVSQVEPLKRGTPHARQGERPRSKKSRPQSVSQPAVVRPFVPGEWVDNATFGAGQVVKVKRDSCVVRFAWDRKEREILNGHLKHTH